MPTIPALTTADLASLRTIEWVDPRGRVRPGGDVLALNFTVKGPRGNKRGLGSMGAARWFLQRKVNRVRFLVSQDGRYCALQPHVTGVLTVSRGNRGDARLDVPVPANTRLEIIELSPMDDMLVGMFPSE